MLNNIKRSIALDNPLRLGYHKIRAVIANLVYRFPSRELTVIGVTGTNGKTTTSNIIAKSLKASGKKVFMFSTVNIIIGDKEFANPYKMTSPDSFILQKYLREAVDQGCEYAIVETASHGIKMNRIWGVAYDMVVLTNITQDHLDLHKTMEDYVNTKLKIFRKLIIQPRKDGIKKTAIINADSDYKDIFLAETYDSVLTYGLINSANLRPKNIETTLLGMKFTIETAGTDVEIDTALRGKFNVYNIAAAVGVLVSLGIKPEQISQLIEKVPGIPGRMERIDNNFGFNIFIDYAHTEDALENVLLTLKEIREMPARIITVFGATGDRDKTKRPHMGSVVSQHSDKVIVTQDDDYGERTEKIIADILKGIEKKQGEDLWVIGDRYEAIRTAIIIAKPGDLILIAGKGDEHTMITNNGPKKWHDATVVRSILKDLEDNTIITNI